jgi:hypothetical protein
VIDFYCAKARLAIEIDVRATIWGIGHSAMLIVLPGFKRMG